LNASLLLDDADQERRFGGLRRLYGLPAYARLRAAHVVVVGVGGVGSWAAEALARSGVARLTLIDLDHVAESNINRQIQATSATLGQAKVQALRERIALIHPACDVRCIEEFVDPENWPGLLHGERPDALIDACDQVSAKAHLAAWALETHSNLVCAGAAGGKRKHHGGARTGPMGLVCVFSRETVLAPQDEAADCAVDSSLNCHGYGSSVMVTAAFGMALAAQAVAACVAPR
jgi:tRNA threonylcarbamoyladenosine dehydratase